MSSTSAFWLPVALQKGLEGLKSRAWWEEQRVTRTPPCRVTNGGGGGGGGHLQVRDDGLHQEEDSGVVLPADVGGGFAEFHAGDGGALRQLLAASLTRQSLPQAVQELLLHTQQAG